MKHHIKNKIIGLLAVLLLLSCNDEFLDTVDPNTIDANNFWQTTADFQKGLAATYAALQFQSVAGGNINTGDRVRTDMCRTFDFYGFQFSTFTWSETEDYIGDRWKEIYVGIFRANQVIEKLGDVTSDMNIDPEDMTLIEGQARFIRGLLYFWIVNSYEGAVVHTTIPDGQDELQGEFVSKEQVVRNVIVPDLKMAINQLPVVWESGDDLGRATSGAARGILGKVYLYEEQFEDAIAQFDTIINSGIYSYILTSSIGENFSTLGEHNDESLFEVGFSEALTPGLAAAEQEVLPNGDQSGHATAKATRAAPQSLGGLRSVVPTFRATELFMMDSIDISNSMNTDRRWSDRAYWSISFAIQDGDYYQQPTLEGPDWFIGGAECAYWKKGTNWYTDVEEETWRTGRSGINERILRFADIKLMYAEALLRKSNSSAADLAEALQQVDDVRERAGVLTLTQYTESLGGAQFMPQLHMRGNRPYQAASFVPINAQNLLTHIQMVERPLELTFEGNSIRWHDLRRWNKIAEVIERYDTIDYKRDWMIYWVSDETAVMPRDMWNDDSTFNSLHFHIDLYQGYALGNYIPELHDYFPVPLDEINANTNINN